jgi:hypothetical protein
MDVLELISFVNDPFESKVSWLKLDGDFFYRSTSCNGTTLLPSSGEEQEERGGEPVRIS